MSHYINPILQKATSPALDATVGIIRSQGIEGTALKAFNNAKRKSAIKAWKARLQSLYKCMVMFRA
ncbi:MAG TPA: hypothetical protein DHV16_05275 [Nitrospiraceae bacterium]|nr:MAG: hypothetical protein A2Z82_06010 [Nitrospirae bacterium GWA2_46_11]OGW23497.1 MAG: hypothetical protein A2X55_03905 [Nitrospirae bacterium GWB2_47_37]HAK87469.1 hypothetical protein [Nitrospiraceae bacterium]HCZ11657.1 hypothetical protein [Nitrospiraceae bacterium]